MKWNNSLYNWDQLNQYWNLVLLLTNANGEIDPSLISKLDKNKKKSLVRLIMHINNVKVYDEEKEVKNLEHKIEDIKIIAEEIKNNVQIIYG